MSYDAPFAGLKVIDLSQGIAAPYAAMLLAQHGAEVVKVEVLDGGDWVRATAPQPGGNTALSVMGNLGKHSIGLDLKSPEGCAVLWRLLEGADVFLEGFRPGVIKRLGFGYEVVSAKHPRIIYLSMSGFGQSGPLAERPAMDPVLQAFIGFTSENRGESGTPRGVASIPVDLMTALYVFQALAAALYARRDETRGRFIEASLLEGAAWLNSFVTLLRAVEGGPLPAPRPPMGHFRTADGWMLIIVAGRRGWPEFCEALERPDLGKDERFTTISGRQQHAELVVSILNDIIASRPTAHWSERFTRFGVMHAVANESMDALHDPHVRAVGLFSHLPQPGLDNPMPIPRIPGTTPMQSGTRRATAPLAGADTETVLAAHGYGPDQIRDLAAKGVVGSTPR